MIAVTGIVKHTRRGLLLLGIALITCLIAGRSLAEPAPIAARRAPQSFSGDSTALKETVIVPTLDTPMPAGKNVIWCASFQIAWNHLKDDIIKAPIILTDYQMVADRLNCKATADTDLPPNSYDALAGFVRRGIIDRIRQEMIDRFPGVALPDFPGTTDINSFVNYAFLRVNTHFPIAFSENTQKFVFTDSHGHGTPVTSFGICGEKDEGKLRAGVNFLYYQADNILYDTATDEFAIDLCKDTPIQIILAHIKPAASLAKTLEQLEKKIASPYGEGYKLRGITTYHSLVIVPVLSWTISHHYQNLLNNPLLNHEFSGCRIADARQDIQFKLNREGDDLPTAADITTWGCTREDYLFNHPFLICIKLRGTPRPFFVMWVDNAELLEKFTARK